MIATLIPYFLVCNISGDSGWPYGPEYVYNVRGNTTIRWDIMSTETIGHVYTTVHCRPKSAGIMSCTTHNLTMSVEINGSRENRQFSEQKPFEVDFNEFGAENLTAPSNLNVTERSFMRIFTTLFTVGSDLSGKTDQDGVFQVMNSSVERFKMNVTIGYPPETEEDSTDNLYELQILPGIHKPIGKAIEITQEKADSLTDVVRELDNSTPPVKDWTATFFTHVEELKYRMKISKHSFESYTHEKGLFRYYAAGLTLFYEGHMEIKLMDVVPADEPIPEISEPTTSPVFEDFPTVN